MSHADTIRDHTLRWEDSGGCMVVAASDFDALAADKEGLSAICDKWEREYVALMAENQQLRDALQTIILWCAINGADRDVVVAASRALDGTPSAAQTLEDPTPHKEKAAS